MDRFAAAAYAPLIMYAWDMCDVDPHNISPAIDPRIMQKGWDVVGFLSAGDDIFKAGSSIRSTVLSSGDQVCYGYVAKKNDELVVVIRGTDGAQEWGDDLDFLMQPHPNPGVPGFVDQGFFKIYSTLNFHPIGVPNKPMPVIQGIQSVVGINKILVLGHSLGAAIATYLLLDLNLENCAASGCLFASPRTGNSEFIDFFEAKVLNYDLFNYERDVVPKVPVADILHFSTYKDLCQVKTIPAAACDATISDSPQCNHHLICYIALLDPVTYRAEIANINVLQDDLNCARCIEKPIENFF